MHVNETITSGFKDYRLKYGSKMEIQKTTFQEGTNKTSEIQFLASGQLDYTTKPLAETTYGCDVEEGCSIMISL
jgi:hypothetical protein